MWLYQQRTPITVLSACPDLPKMFRKSTGTKDKREALWIARSWSLIIENNWRKVLKDMGYKQTGGTLTLTVEDIELTPPQIKPNKPEPPKTSQKSSKSLTQLVEKYIQWRTINRAAGTVKEDKKALKWLMLIFDYLGVETLEDLTVDAVRDYRDILVKLPKNRGNKYDHMSIKEMLGLDWSGELQSIKNLDKQTTLVSSFLKWLDENEGYLDTFRM